MQPLAQNFTTIARSPDPAIFCYEPGLVKLPSGALLCTYEYVTQFDSGKGGQKQADWFFLARSADGGESWQDLPPLTLHSGMPFVYDGMLYLLGHRLGRRDIVILRSTDEGESWSEPVTLFTGLYWNAPMEPVIKDGMLYRAYGCPAGEQSDDILWVHSVVTACDLAQDLLDPAAWRMSNRVAYPGTPDVLKRNKAPNTPDTCLEPNVVDIGGELKVLLRIRIDGQHVAGMACVCDLDDDGQTLDYRFGQLYPVPFAQNKFHILYDETSRYFWAAGNMVTNIISPIPAGVKARGYAGSGGNERRILMLCCSIDAHSWFPVGCIAMSRDLTEAFNYPSAIVDGDDYLVAVRTALGRTVNQNKSNMITFHRVKDFRSLALDLHPEED